MLTNIIVEYLKHNKRLVVPKLGAFIVKQPSGVIIFTEFMRNDDGVLLSLLTAYGINPLEANGMIDRFVFEIKHAINIKHNFIIEDFGEFLPGENNTITFRHKHEPQVIGGNIKPPVEILNSEKSRLLGIDIEESATHKNATTPSTKGTTPRAKREESEMLNLGKPDAYLRGLNYDKRKKKTRNEEQKRGDRRGRGISPTTLIIILLVIAGAAYGIWRWYGSMEQQPLSMEPIYDHELMEMTDTLNIDELTETTIVTDSLNIEQL